MGGSDARALSRSLLDLCRMRKLTIATAESCTGGLVAGALTDIPGSSDVIDRGFVTYSTPGKPVGLVHFAVAARDGRIVHREQRFGAIGRSTVRQRSVVEALRMLMELARPPQAAKPRREAASRLRPRVARSPRSHAAKRRRPPRG